MRFENPFALLLLLLIPLLFFLRRQRTQSTLPVGNLYLWRESTARDVDTVARRIRRDWLQILQAAFLALIAFGMARPVVSDSSRSTVFIFDTSLSMGARNGAGSRLERAKSQADAILAQLPSDARLQILSSDAQTPIAGPFLTSDGAVRTAIRSIRVTDGHGDLPAALERARQSRPLPDRLYVFSDTDDPQTRGKPSDLEWIRVGERADNAAIRTFSARPAIGRPDHVQALLSISNYGRAPLDTMVRLTRQQAEVARQRVSVAPHATESYSIDLPAVAGVLEARLDHEDALPSDNVRWIVVPAAEPIRVQVPSPMSRFLAQAIAAHPGFVAVGPNADADVIVCAPCSSLPEGTAGVLRLASPSEPSTAVVLSGFNPDHPLADGLEVDGAGALLHKATHSATGVVVVRGNGEPAVIAEETGSRRVVDVRLDVDGGSFPLNPAFPVLVSNAVRWLAARGANQDALIAGEPLQWHLNGPHTPIVTSADGRTLPATFKDGILSFTATNVAGVYRVASATGQSQFVVNPAVDGESNVDDPDSSSSLDTATAPAAGSIEHRSLTATLLFAALLLLALEWRQQLRASA